MKFEATRVFRAPAAALVIAATFGVCAPAISAADEKAVTAVVQASDLNLATANGQRTLERRTASAIDKVCPLRGSLAVGRADSTAAYRQCASSVRASVKQQLTDRGGRPVAGT